MFDVIAQFRYLIWHIWTRIFKAQLLSPTSKIKLLMWAIDQAYEISRCYWQSWNLAREVPVKVFFGCCCFSLVYFFQVLHEQFQRWDTLLPCFVCLFLINIPQSCFQVYFGTISALQLLPHLTERICIVEIHHAFENCCTASLIIQIIVC